MGLVASIAGVLVNENINIVSLPCTFILMAIGCELIKAKKRNMIGMAKSMKKEKNDKRNSTK